MVHSCGTVLRVPVETEKVSLASFHLEGEANQWWQWLRRAYKEEGKDVTWSIFVEELWSRFGPTDREDFDEALSRVKQTGSLRDYQREFERLGNRVQGWTQKALVGTFMGGLKAEIADGIRMFKPKTLKEAISLARMRDDQMTRQQKSGRLAGRPATIITPSTKAKPASPMKRLTWDEMQKRRAQGLCFHCDEKLTPGHRCQGPQLLILDGNLEETEDEEPQLEISLHALTGLAAYQTMRVHAKIRHGEMVALIDSGSAHNFIDEKKVNMLQLPLIPTEPFLVKIANGRSLKCQGKFENVPVEIQGKLFFLTLYALPGVGSGFRNSLVRATRHGDVQLEAINHGIQWNHQIHKLQGIKSQPIQTASMKSISKEMRRSSSLAALCLQAMILFMSFS